MSLSSVPKNFYPQGFSVPNNFLSPKFFCPPKKSKYIKMERVGGGGWGVPWKRLGISPGKGKIGKKTTAKKAKHFGQKIIK